MTNAMNEGGVRGLATRGAVTLFACLAMWRLAWLEVPYAWVYGDAEAFGGWRGPRAWDVLPGFGPIFGAFLAVELSAALVPRWRALRRDGHQGRAQLRRVALGLGVLFAALQLVGVVFFARSAAWQGHHPNLTLASLGVVCVVALVMLGGLLDRFALGAGFALLFVATGAGDPAELSPLLKLSDPLGALLPFALLGGCCAALELGARWPNAQASFWPIPVSSLVAVLWPALALGRSQEAGMPGLASGREVLLWSFGALILALVLAQLTARLPSPLRDDHAWRERRRSAIGVSMALVFALALLEFGLPLVIDPVTPSGSVRGAFRPLYYITVAAFLLDAVHELRARRRLGELTSVWEEPRGWAVAVALAALEAKGIRAFVRGARFHALYQVFGPQFAARILVPPGDVARARAVLAVTFGVEPALTRNAPQTF